MSTPLLRRGGPPTSTFAHQKTKTRHAPLEQLQEPPGLRVCSAIQQLCRRPSCELTLTQAAALECEPPVARVACPPEACAPRACQKGGLLGEGTLGARLRIAFLRLCCSCVARTGRIPRRVQPPMTACLPFPTRKAGARRFIWIQALPPWEKLHGYFSVGARVGSAHA